MNREDVFLWAKFLLDILNFFSKIFLSSEKFTSYPQIFRKEMIAMKRNSYNHNAHMKAKVATQASEADYERAMKMYKQFAYVSGLILTVAYALVQLF